MEIQYTGTADITLWLKGSTLVNPRLSVPIARPGTLAVGLDYIRGSPSLVVATQAKPGEVHTKRLWFLLPVTEVVRHTTFVADSSVGYDS